MRLLTHVCALAGASLWAARPSLSSDPQRGPRSCKKRVAGQWQPGGSLRDTACPDTSVGWPGGRGDAAATPPPTPRSRDSPTCGECICIQSNMTMSWGPGPPILETGDCGVEGSARFTHPRSPTPRQRAPWWWRVRAHSGFCARELVLAEGRAPAHIVPGPPLLRCQPTGTSGLTSRGGSKRRRSEVAQAPIPDQWADLCVTNSKDPGTRGGASDPWPPSEMLLGG